MCECCCPFLIFCLFLAFQRKVRILTTQKSLTTMHLMNFYRWSESTTLSDHLSFFSLLGMFVKKWKSLTKSSEKLIKISRISSKKQVEFSSILEKQKYKFIPKENSQNPILRKSIILQTDRCLQCLKKFVKMNFIRNHKFNEAKHFFPTSFKVH